jgi:Ca-activated chloride channel homolog
MPMQLGASFLLLLLTFAVLGWPKPQATSDQEKPPQDVIGSHVDLVSVYFTVRDDKKHLVSELAQNQFTVSEDGHPQAIKFFAHHSDVVLNVGVLLDTGTNMDWIRGEEAQASKMFVRHVVRPTDLGFIVSYASRIETVQLPTSDVRLLVEAAGTVGSGAAAIGLPDGGSGPSPHMGYPGGGGTVGINGKPVDMHREAHLYDAIRNSTREFLSQEVGRKAIVIVALSGDSRSESTMDDALKALFESDVIAYVLQISDAPHEHAEHDNCDVLHVYERDAHGEYVLKKLAEATGGRMLEVKGITNLESALDEISEELHHQYSLGYYPENKNWDGNFRKIQISAGEKGYKVYARRGYYANRPAPKQAAEKEGATR